MGISEDIITIVSAMRKGYGRGMYQGVCNDDRVLESLHA
jgi:hypothetical protein